MSLAALALSALLSTAPFPPPRSFQPSDATRCDWVKVVSVDAARRTLVGRAADGLVTFLLGADVRVYEKDGKPGAVDRLATGQALRVYYVVDAGARVQEIDAE